MRELDWLKCLQAVQFAARDPQIRLSPFPGFAVVIGLLVS